MRKTCFPLMLIICMLLFAVSFGSAQTTVPEENAATREKNEEDKEKNRRYLYEWTDENGTVSITDDLCKVPEEYLPHVKKRLETSGTPQPGEGREQNAPPAEIREQSGEEDRESGGEMLKEEWQERIREWKERLARAEESSRELSNERSMLINRWGILEHAPLDDQNRVRQIEQELIQIRKDVGDARQMIDVVIPEEARKAGVPPGWLRE